MNLVTQRPALLAVLLAALGGCDQPPTSAVPLPAPTAERTGGNDAGERVSLLRTAPMRFHLNGDTGWAAIRLAGRPDGAVGGEMSITIGGDRTEYVVHEGTWLHVGERVQWQTGGVQMALGDGSVRFSTFRSTLVASATGLRDGDTWRLGEVDCTYDAATETWWCIDNFTG
jgi:hypothetical protein